ncbi:MAG: sialidase family protein [Verrucomicrobiota bacterium]
MHLKTTGIITMKLHIVATSIAVRGMEGTRRAINTFPSLVTLSCGDVLLAYRVGSTKDGDDETVELRRSADAGRSWGEPVAPFPDVLNGVRGSQKLAYLTEVPGGVLLAATMWINRVAHPGKPLFNAETEGCLPIAILIFESTDGGRSWGTGLPVPMPASVGPPSLTAPLLRLSDGRLAMSIESNKHYDDPSPWFQFVSYFHSADNGRHWTGPTVVAQDPTGRIFNWDQRAGVAPDGRIASFTWTYDSTTKKYVNIHRRISADGGVSWSAPEDLGIADQAGRPAILPDGRVVLSWVDRFVSHSIRARAARGIDAPLEAGTELELYRLETAAEQESPTTSTGELLADMGLWTFGLPFAERMPDGDVLVAYYAGAAARMDIRLARLQVS